MPPSASTPLLIRHKDESALDSMRRTTRSILDKLARWIHGTSSDKTPGAARFVTGILLLLCVVVLWTLSNFITSDLLEGGYDKPFLVTYLNTSAFSLYLVPFLYKRYKRRNHPGHIQIERPGHERQRSRRVSQDYMYTPLEQEDEHGQDRSPRVSTTNIARTIGLKRSNSMIRSLSPSPALITHAPLSSELAASQTPLLSPHHEHPPSITTSPVTATHMISTQSTHSSPKLTTTETAHLAALFCVVWFAANWTVNASLGLTSVASSTVLAGMSGFFTLGLGRIFGVEKFTRYKVLAVGASFIGLILVTHSDSLLARGPPPPHPPPPPPSSLPPHHSSPHTIFHDLGFTLLDVPPHVGIPPRSTPHEHVKRPILGDGLALLSAFCYAVYVILLKVRIGDEERVDMQLFFGFVGLFNTLFLFPLVPLLSWLGVETFQLPTKRSDWIVCGVNMAITLSSDYLYVLAMLKTTPLVVTIGLSLTIPFAMLGDFVRGSTASLSLQAVCGAGLVIVGFGLMGFEGLGEDADELEEASIKPDHHCEPDLMERGHEQQQQQRDTSTASTTRRQGDQEGYRTLEHS